MNDDKARIEHMVEHIKRIQTQLQNVTEEQFYNSLVLVDAVSFNFAILGKRRIWYQMNCMGGIRLFRGEISSECVTS